MKSERKHKISEKTGQLPGTLFFVGNQKIDKPKLTFYEFCNDSVQITDVNSIDEIPEPGVDSLFYWLNVSGLHDTGLVESIGTKLGLHILSLEDIVNTETRPKVEFNDNYIFTVLKLVDYNIINSEVQTGQVSFILGKNFLISFNENEPDLFILKEEKLNQILKNSHFGPDYLYYILFDILVDNYYLTLEKINDDIEILDDELMSNPTNETLNKIHKLKRTILNLHKCVWPLREVVTNIKNERFPIIRSDIRMYINDLYDHTIQIEENLDSLRDISSSMVEIFLTGTSNRMNEVMKVLTIIATIFIPLTFIAGVYGMNFKSMPELDWPYGYIFSLTLMASVSIGMLIFFKRRKWF